MGWGVFVDEGNTRVHFQSACCDLTPLGACVLKDEMDAGISMFYLGKLSPCPGHTTFHCVQMLLKCCWRGQSRIKSCFCLLYAGYCFFFLPPNLNNFTSKGDTSYSFPGAGKIREKDM